MKSISLKVIDKPKSTEMMCYVSEPKTKAKAGIIVLQEAFGVNNHIKDLTKRFAEEGYVAIAPELYHRTAPVGWTCDYQDFTPARPHISALKEDGTVADVQACFDWLTTSANLSAVACVGYCLGGRAAFISNSKIPLKAAISYYGGRIAPDHLNLAAKQIAPLLFFWGGQDKHIPPEQIHTVMAALSEAKKSFINVEISYADHGFFCDERGTYNKAAAQLSWTTTIEFLKSHM